MGIIQQSINFEKKYTPLKTNLIPSSLTIQAMTSNDFELVKNWCLREGWNVGLYDAAINFQTDINGHFILFDEERPVASMSLVKHSDYLFTIGPFIVEKSARNKGYGAKIWQQVTARLQGYPNASVLLYAVPEQMKRYVQEGFEPCYTNLRWVINPVQVSSKPFDKPKPITPCNLDKIAKYDEKIFTVSRKKSFAEALSNPEIKGYFIEVDNQTKGYGFIRPCMHGFRIGALYSDTPEIAKNLLLNLLELAGKESVIIDMPEINQAGHDLMVEIGAKRNKTCDTIAMVKGTLSAEYKYHLDKNFGLFSLEIG